MSIYIYFRGKYVDIHVSKVGQNQDNHEYKII